MTSPSRRRQQHCTVGALCAVACCLFCFNILAAILPVANPAGPGSSEPFLFSAPDGSAWMSWLEPKNGKTRELRFSQWNGRSWTAPGLIGSGSDWFVNSADVPSIVTLPDGSMAAHWLEQNAGHLSYGIRLARSFDGGKSWKVAYVPSVERPDSYTGFASLLPTQWGLRMAYLAPQPSPPAAAGPSRSAVGASTLRFASFRRDGSIESDIDLDRDVCTCCPLATGMTTDGPVIAYRDHLAGDIRDISVVKWTSGEWSAPIRASSDGWKISACPVNGPALDARNATAVLVWYTAAQGTPKIQAAWSQDSARTFGRAVRLDGGTPTGNPAVALLDDGSAVACWVEKTPHGVEVSLRRVMADGRLGPRQVVAAVAAHSVGTPRLAVTGNRVMVAWTTDRVQTAEITIPSQ